MEKLTQLELTNCLGGINLAIRIIANCIVNTISYLFKIMIGSARR